MYICLARCASIQRSLLCVCVCLVVVFICRVCMSAFAPLSLPPPRAPLSPSLPLPPSTLRIPPAPAPVTHAASLRGAGVPLRGAVALCPLVATTSAATPLDDALAVDFARMLKDVTPTGDLPPTHHTPGQNLKATKKKKSNTRLRARRGRVQ